MFLLWGLEGPEKRKEFCFLLKNDPLKPFQSTITCLSVPCIHIKLVVHMHISWTAVLAVLGPKVHHACTKIHDWIRQHRTRINKKSGKGEQVNRTPESTTKWFRDHPDVLRKLKAEIIEEQLPQETISETIFENCSFKELPSIKNWILELRGREAKEETIRRFVNDIKRVCKGEIRKKGANREYEIIDGWGLKHPDRLTLEDALTYISELRKRGMHACSKRIFQIQSIRSIRNRLRAIREPLPNMVIAKPPTNPSLFFCFCSC